MFGISHSIVHNNAFKQFFYLEGDAALLEAAKKGNLGRVQKLATPENINCRDTQGRNSTPLHLAGKHGIVVSLYE